MCFTDVPCNASILALSTGLLSVFCTFPDIEPEQSKSLQSMVLSQSLSKLSVHAISKPVFSIHFPETAVLQTPFALSHVESSHCWSTPSLSASVPVLDQSHPLGHD